jgi:hypothetical protein
MSRAFTLLFQALSLMMTTLIIPSSVYAQVSCTEQAQKVDYFNGEKKRLTQEIRILRSRDEPGKESQLAALEAELEALNDSSQLAMFELTKCINSQQSDMEIQHPVDRPMHLLKRKDPRQPPPEY